VAISPRDSGIQYVEWWCRKFMEATLLLRFFRKFVKELCKTVFALCVLLLLVVQLTHPTTPVIPVVFTTIVKTALELAAAK
jgi:hypothetical protein